MWGLNDCRCMLVHNLQVNASIHATFNSLLYKPNLLHCCKLWGLCPVAHISFSVDVFVHSLLKRQNLRQPDGERQWPPKPGICPSRESLIINKVWRSLCEASYRGNHGWSTAANPRWPAILLVAVTVWLCRRTVGRGGRQAPLGFLGVWNLLENTSGMNTHTHTPRVGWISELNSCFMKHSVAEVQLLL